MPLLRFGRALPTTLREWNRVLQEIGLAATDGELTVSDAGPDGPVTLGLADHGTAGTYPVVTTDAKGRVSSGRALAETDIPAEIARDTEVAAAIVAAVDAHEADTSDVHAAADYAQTDANETIAGTWTFEQPTTFENKVEIYTAQGGGWRDMLGNPIARRAAGVGVPVWTNWVGGSPFYSYKFVVGDSLQFVYHLQHDYAPGTGIFLHTHWITDGTDTGLVKWQFDWTFAKGFNQGTASNFSTAAATTSVEQAGSGTAFRHMTSEIATAITDADFEVDGILIVNISRVAPSSGSNGDSVLLVTADCHYQSNTFNTKGRAPDFYT